MRCIVTAGPTYEPLDQVRRLTNFSTGRLGSELVNFLAARGHEVTLLIGQQATWRGERHARRLQTFTTTASLREGLRSLAAESVDAVFHAAAVSDFAFGKISARSAAGDLTEISSGKISTRQGTLLAELVPTPKIIAELRHWYPRARLVGWKYEVEGDRPSVIELAEKQNAECQTDACVANGPAYGAGFGLVKRGGGYTHLADTTALFEALESFTLEVRLS
ncbi:MAG TPA: phosphopantothenoylcysteine decarboxylase [Candidatus Binatia bacterium]|jgi:phosphopantothenoylcysteine synthetase/decarboxylase|nr:phosphopantothenoylcysteine decarboxylase [Candidatus Binatia bacterium]